MALLVNHEGSYKEPQKLWYLINGIWKEVINVFESPVQQEIALLDTERISQDQTVLALSTRIKVLQLSLDGTDPTITILTDPVEITKTQKLLEALNLQLEISRLEQVAITKELFEQKAQLEYKKLVLNGEIAIQKIIKVVVNPSEWGVIRLDPQSTLDERLEVAIQHDLGTDERIFNYGAVYYRLYKLDQSKPEDNLANLSPNFKRRLSNAAFLAGTLATNYIMTTLTVQKAFEEVNQFVNSGAKRIEDYLFSLKEQNKFILDGIEKVKENMVLLNEIVLSGDLPEMVIDGKIINLATKPELQKPLGNILLRSQKAESVDHLVSMKNLTDIAEGTLNINDLPNPSIYTNLSSNLQSLNEKTEAVSLFLTNNTQLSNDLATGVLQFGNLNVIGSRKQQLNYSKSLFWSSPLGDSTLAKAGQGVTYTQGYTSSGKYKFKSDQMVELSTEYIAIIQTILANTKVGVLGVSFGTHPISIIQVLDTNTIVIDISTGLEANNPAIVSALEAETKVYDLNQNASFNESDQAHTAIPVVMETNSKIPVSLVDLAVYHPVINTVFYPTTKVFPVSTFVGVDTIAFDRAFMVYQLGKDSPSTIGSFSFNAAEENPIKTEFVVSQPLESIQESVLNFNCYSTNNEFPKTNFTISFIDLPDLEPALMIFNPVLDPLSSTYLNLKDNAIIIQDPMNANFEYSFNFNPYQMVGSDGIEYLPKNGYAEITYSNIDNIDNTPVIIPIETHQINGIEVITFNDPSLYMPVAKQVQRDIFKETYEFTEHSRIIITSQTGLQQIEIYEPEMINKEVTTMPKIISARTVRIIDLDDSGSLGNLSSQIEKINTSNVNSIIVTTNINNKTSDLGLNSDLGVIKPANSSHTINITQVDSKIHDINNTETIETMETINRSNSDLIVFGTQLNPGVEIAS